MSTHLTKINHEIVDLFYDFVIFTCVTCDFHNKGKGVLRSKHRHQLSSDDSMV